MQIENIITAHANSKLFFSPARTSDQHRWKRSSCAVSSNLYLPIRKKNYLYATFICTNTSGNQTWEEKQCRAPPLLTDNEKENTHECLLVDIHHLLKLIREIHLVLRQLEKPEASWRRRFSPQRWHTEHIKPTNTHIISFGRLFDCVEPREAVPLSTLDYPRPYIPLLTLYRRMCPLR